MEQAADSQDDIRLKRLQRLQQPQQPVEGAAQGASSPATQSQTPPPAPKPSTPKPAPEELKPTPRETQKSPASPVDYEHDVIARIFGVTLVDIGPQTSRAEQEPPPVFLEQCATDIITSSNGDTEALKLRRIRLDSVLAERIAVPVSTLPRGEPQSGLEYLLRCFRRASDEVRRVSSNAERKAIVEECRGYVVSYLGIYLLNPEAFADRPGILASGSSQRTLPDGLLEALITRFENEGLENFINPLLQKISDSVKGVGLMGTYQGWVRILLMLLSHKAVAALFVEHPSFLPPPPKPNIFAPRPAIGLHYELFSLLGPFFGIHALPDHKEAASINRSFYPDPNNISQQALDDAHKSIRLALRPLHEALRDIMLKLLRGGPGPKSKALDWIAKMIDANFDKTKYHYDPRLYATHGFTLNLCAVMLELFKPFLEGLSPPGAKPAIQLPAAEKRKKFDPNYYQESARMDVSKDTKIAVESAELDAWVDKRNLARIQAWQHRQKEVQTAGPRPSTSSGTSASASESGEKPPLVEYPFSTECYFMMLRSIFVGFTPAVKELKHLQENFWRYKEAYEKSKNIPSTGPQHDEQMKKLKEEYDQCSRDIFAFEAQLLEPEFASGILKVAALSGEYLLDLVDPNRQGPSSLPTPPPMEFAALPEHLIDDIFEAYTTFLYNGRNATMFDGMAGASRVECPSLLVPIVNLAAYFVPLPAYARNPYLRSKLAELLSAFMTHKVSKNSDPILLVDHLEKIPAARDYLVTGMMRLYVDIEHTGSHTQFYDKFNVRHHISQVIEKMWVSQHFRKRVHAEYQASVPRETGVFMRFVNFLLNDFNFLLEDCLGNLKRIRDLQQMPKTPEWTMKSEQERRELQAELEQKEKMVASFMRLADDSVKMLVMLSAELGEPFVEAQMVDRIAASLNETLKRLVGPACIELKVENPDKLYWRPKELLKNIMMVYLHLQKYKQFPEAVIKEKRSYDTGLLVRAGGIARRVGLFPEPTLAEWDSFAAICGSLEAHANEEEEQLGEVPDEFLDPITAEIMDDPVTLPTSGNICDRSVITRHLLSDETDPFNRKHLTVEQLIPNVELKEKIQAFRDSRLRKK
eukprot:tig00000076_g2403.t1